MSFFGKLIKCKDDGSCMHITENEVEEELKKWKIEEKTSKKKCKGKNCKKNVNSAKNNFKDVVFISRGSELNDIKIGDFDDSELL